MTSYQKNFCKHTKGKTQPRTRRDAWGLDYRRVTIQSYKGWILTITRLSDGKMLACYHGNRRPQVREVRCVLAQALLHYNWPKNVWVDEWLSQFAATECEKYDILMHIRVFRNQPSQKGIDYNGDEYAARLNRIMGIRDNYIRPNLSTLFRWKTIRPHWMN